MAVDGGPTSLDLPPPAVLETCPLRLRRFLRSSCSKPRTRWSTCAAASRAATSEAAEPISIYGLMLSQSPGTAFTANAASSALEGVSVPPFKNLASFRPRTFCVATLAPVALSNSIPRSATEASAGTRTTYSRPRCVTRTDNSSAMRAAFWLEITLCEW